MRSSSQDTSPRAGAASAESRLRRALGGRLARLREEHGWTQEEVAGRLGTSQHVISHYERGAHSPKLITLLRLRQLFSISLDYLVAGAAPGEIADIRLRKLALAADALPPDHRTLLATTLQSLVEAMQRDVERRSSGSEP